MNGVDILKWLGCFQRFNWKRINFILTSICWKIPVFQYKLYIQNKRANEKTYSHSSLLILNPDQYMENVNPLATWLKLGEKGLMGRPYTHESLGKKQGKPGGLVVQTLGAKWGGHVRARHEPRASQTSTAGVPNVYLARIASGLDAHHACTTGKPNRYRARTRLMWCRWRLRAIFGI